MLKNFISNLFKKEPCQDTADTNVSFSYIIKYSSKANKADKLPLLIALHGDGDTVESFYRSIFTQIKVPARIILIKGPITHEIGYVWPYSVAQFKKYGSPFSQIVTSLTTQYPTSSRPILLGFSGGGGMAYYQSIKQGDIYSCIFSISSLLAKEKLGYSAVKPCAKVYAYHGKRDAVIPFHEAEKTIKLLKRKKVKVKFTEFKGGHQGLFTDMKATVIKDIETQLLLNS